MSSVINIPVWSCVADAELPGKFRIGWADMLSEDLHFLIYQRRRVIVTFPNDEVPIEHTVVGDGRINGRESGVSNVSHEADLEVIGANLFTRDATDELAVDFKLA